MDTSVFLTITETAGIGLIVARAVKFFRLFLLKENVQWLANAFDRKLRVIISTEESVNEGLDIIASEMYHV